MWKRRRIWLIRRLVLGLAVAAVVASPAAARIDEGVGTLRASPPIVEVSDFRVAEIRAQQLAESEQPINRPGLDGAGRPSVGNPVRSDDGSGVDWGDAAVGAGTVLGLALLAAGVGLIVVRRSGREATA